jgi:predicted peroxiredoxin
MQMLIHEDISGPSHAELQDVFIVLCASGFDNVERVRSALMFATLASSAEYRTILFCIQGAVDVIVEGSSEEKQRVPERRPLRSG